MLISVTSERVGMEEGKNAIQILFEDDDILVINKPAGAIVNKADTTRYHYTIQEWAEKKINLVPGESDFYKRGGVVHRLDKDTSGALILAKNEESFVAIQAQFKQKEVQKVYRALSHGKVTPPEGEINVPIGRLPWNRMRFGVLPQGRESVTKYKVLHYYLLKDGKREEILSFVELYPKTGRTHQIRVHMQYLGFPLFSDSLYAGRKNIKRDKKVLSRHFLHASKISFIHPKTKKRIDIDAPLSSELSAFLSGLSDGPSAR